MSGYYADISEFQVGIDWPKYVAWSKQFDGISRVALRSSYGTGFTDKMYQKHLEGARNAGIDVVIHYHYAYPNLNAPEKEADWQKSVVGSIGPKDLLMLDYEEQVSQANSAWCLSWLQEQEKNYPDKLPCIYASHAYVWSRLQDIRLARYGLILAHWQTQDMPACPMPWSRYTALQYTDKASNIPGMPFSVDCNIWL